jgi:hypothetical protein
MPGMKRNKNANVSKQYPERHSKVEALIANNSTPPHIRL